MKCSSAKKMITPFLEDTLGAVDTIRLVRHLKHCEDCQDELEVTYLVSLLQTDADTEPDSYELDKALQRMRANRMRRINLIGVLIPIDLMIVAFVIFLLIYIFT